MNPEQPTQPVSYNSSPGAGRKNLLTTVILVLLLVAALGFGGWAFSKMQDYKTNSDKKAALAVAQAEASQKLRLQADFDQQNKSPDKTFTGSATYGSISFNYPKTWSAYVDSSNASEPINAYFHPDQVPGINSKTAYSLRVELVSTDYAQLVQQYSSYVKLGTITAKAYVPPKLSGVANVTAGTMFSGPINPADNTQTGTLLIIKVRDKTLEISTQSNDYLADFNNTVLPSLSFVP
jgi:cytoskeletal protein RodZ